MTKTIWKIFPWDWHNYPNVSYFKPSNRPNEQSVLNILSRLTEQDKTAIAASIPHRQSARTDYRIVHK
jgi:hypothetical protein